MIVGSVKLFKLERIFDCQICWGFSNSSIFFLKTSCNQFLRSNKDIPRISLTAYDASRYGTIDGEVLKVSADAVEDKSTGMSYYLVDVSMDTTLYEDDGSAIEILPGMVASIDVLAGKRTIFDYIWQPMAKVKERAFTD